MSTGATARKLPRVDLRKFLSGGVAGRREAVSLVGDALREEGVVRVEGHGAADADGLAEVGVHLLAALADYFGLAPNAFAVGVASPAEGWSAEPDVLLVVLAGVPPGTELRPAGADEWRTITAHPGELAAVPCAALATMTGGVVPAAMVRWAEGATHAVALSAPPGATLTALPEFR
jgi:isopenicillin N synthase-like dioxygenase